MSFDDSSISDLRIKRLIGGIVLAWNSSEPDGTFFQVYIDGLMIASTMKRSIMLPHGTPGRSRFIQVGKVDPSEANQITGSLPSAPTSGDRPRITWSGGTYLSESIESFCIYRSSTPGGSVSYSNPIGIVPAYPNGIIEDGAGVGRAGQGGAGRSESIYSIRVAPLPTGTWRFGIKPRDSAGNLGTAIEMNVSSLAFPTPPKMINGSRLNYTYNSGTRVATITWTP